MFGFIYLIFEISLISNIPSQGNIGCFWKRYGQKVADIAMDLYSSDIQT